MDNHAGIEGQKPLSQGDDEVFGGGESGEFRGLSNGVDEASITRSGVEEQGERGEEDSRGTGRVVDSERGKVSAPFECRGASGIQPPETGRIPSAPQALEESGSVRGCERGDCGRIIRGQKRCVVCGSLLGYWKSKYCSRPCFLSVQAKASRLRYKTSHKAWIPLRVQCPVCYVDFVQRGTGQKYCGISCRRKSGSNKRHRNNTEQVCKVCGQPFQSIRQRLYCSKKCCRKAHPRKRGVESNARRRLKRKERYRTDLEYRRRCIQRAALRVKTDPISRISQNLRKRIRKLIGASSSVSSSLIGCSGSELRKWLESKWTPAMTWENYGTFWVVDHRIPLAAFDLNDLRQRKLACHFTNLQPLQTYRNLKKSARITDGQIHLPM